MWWAGAPVGETKRISGERCAVAWQVPQKANVTAHFFICCVIRIRRISPPADGAGSARTSEFRRLTAFARSHGARSVAQRNRALGKTEQTSEKIRNGAVSARSRTEQPHPRRDARREATPTSTPIDPCLIQRNGVGYWLFFMNLGLRYHLDTNCLWASIYVLCDGMPVLEMITSYWGHMENGHHLLLHF